MTLNTTMIHLLHKIVNKAPNYEHGLTEHGLMGDEFVSIEAGNELIQLYSETENLETREVITNLMKEAGDSWLRKLITRDTTAVYH